MPDLLSLLGALLVGLLYDPEQRGPFEPDPRLGAAAAAAGVLLAALFGRALRRGPRGPGKGWARAYLAFRLHPLVVHAAVVHLFHWPTVADAFGVGRCGAAVSVLLVLPFLATQGVVWAWVWGIERPDAVELRPWLGFHYRSAALLLLPYVFYAAATDALSLSRTARVLLRTWSVAEEAEVGAVLAALGILLPVGARRIWKTRPLAPGALRDRLVDAARRLSFRCRDILVWDTAGLVANAAIVGFLARWRYVVFTDALLAALRPEEVEAVFGHEAGHAKRRHVATFFAFAGAWALALLVVARSYSPGGEGEILAFLVPSALLWWLGFGWLSRRFELEADLYGAAAVGDVGTFVSALERVGRVTGTRRGRGSWRHFSVGSRVAFLYLVASAPEVGERFLARVRRWIRLGLLALVVAAAFHVLDLARRTPGELGWAFVRLGDYVRAERLLARAAPREEQARERLALARFGRALFEHTGGRPAAALERTRDALQVGDLEFVGLVVALLDARVEDPEGEETVREMKRLLEAKDREGLEAFLDGKGRSAFERFSTAWP
ncbi:MAG TPA: M48 family metallopeptidase [Planctomycetota bacterium]|nr:M48 family metallopeptidase [Planctomycetota bacterium]